MKKYLIFFILAIICVSFNAQALVQQSASQALSYNNVYSPKPKLKRTVAEPAVKEEVKQVVPEAKSIDIGGSVSKNVSLVKGQEVIISMVEKQGQTWKATYDTSIMSMLNNKLSGNRRVVTFKQKTDRNSTIFFDCVDEEGKTIQNKAVYIKVN